MAGSVPGFCRDCLADAGPGPRCTACGSPRLARHPEIDALAVAHVDCDAFFASVEKRDDPSLADVPLIIGGGMVNAALLATSARIAILVLSAAMALREMGIANDIINLAFGLLLGAVAVAVALAFGLGGREVAGQHLSQWSECLKNKEKQP